MSEPTFRVRMPNSVTLLTTFRCNAECPYCCFGCRANRGATMTLYQMKRYIDKCMEAFSSSLTYFCLTGGECLLLGPVTLEAIYKYASSLGLRCTMVTNGFWGRDYDKAHAILYRLRRAGLAEVAFSAGADHNSKIPFRGCRNAIAAASRLGLDTTIRLEEGLHNSNSPIKKAINEDVALTRQIKAGKVKVDNWTWQHYDNETVDRGEYPWRMSHPGTLKGCESVFSTLPITPYGDLVACCGIAVSRLPYMRLGNVEKESVKTLFERGAQDPLKVWLGTQGSRAILRYVARNSKIRFYGSGNHCQGCVEIFSNPKILPFLRESYADWAPKIYQSPK